MKVIYAILNLKNQKLYIGSTSNFSRRKKEHLNELKANKHHSIKLQNAWNKYSEKDFIFIILEKLSEEDNLKSKEQYYLNLYNSYEKGYNSSRSTDRPDNSILWRKVYQFDMAGNYVNEYENFTLAADAIGCSSSGLRICAIEKYRFYAGYIWSLSKELSQERIFLANNPIKRTKESKERMSISAKNRIDNKIPIMQYDLEGNFIKEWESAAEAGRIVGISNGQICDALKGNWPQAKGFIWKYKNEINQK